MTQHLIVVDDEAEIRELLQDYLSGHGFEVSTADGGAAMRAILAEKPAQLAILDLRMPGEDGFALARWLRQTTRIGIIMLTASSDNIDRIVGLELGADDYMSKPFDPRELLARVRSVLRRVEEVTAAPQPAVDGTPDATDSRVPMGRCVLDLEARRLLDSDGAELPLTAMEFDLLRVFAERPGRTLSRDQLLDLAHNKDMEAFDRSIDLRIMRLRRKIEWDPGQPEVLKTVRGLGYVFTPGKGSPA